MEATIDTQALFNFLSGGTHVDFSDLSGVLTPDFPQLIRIDLVGSEPDSIVCHLSRIFLYSLIRTSRTTEPLI